MAAVDVKEQVTLLSKIPSHVILPVNQAPRGQSLGTISLCERDEPSRV
jgi:hypothetical protein